MSGMERPTSMAGTMGVVHTENSECIGSEPLKINSVKAAFFENNYNYTSFETFKKSENEIQIMGLNIETENNNNIVVKDDDNNNIEDKEATRTKDTVSDDALLKPLPGSVKHFYYGTNIFITGGTGFLGKALLEKLLRSCEGIKCIYILMRQKRGLNVEQRHKELLKNQIFDRIRDKWPERLEKIRPVEGDVSQADLGMSPADTIMLQDQVNIVIHSAATIRFIEPLSEALTLNTLGTKRLIELCHKIKSLKSIVHVSTAYSNSDKNSEILEKFYPVEHDPDSLLQCSAALPQELMDIITPRIQGSHPNTYTLTKALGEQIILKYGAGLPICIIRPSIVTAAYKEPYPGWIDNLFGVTGIVMEISRGTIRSAICREQGIMDLVPVDIAVNSCITAAWNHTKYKRNEPLIYNCTSGGTNPLTWYQFSQFAVEHARESPTKYVMMYPNFHYTTNRLANLFWELTTHYLPSIVFDIIMKAQGKKPIMMKLARRFKMATLTGEFFAMNQFTFNIDNMKTLFEDLEQFDEHTEFLCDVRPVDWKAYMSCYLMGIRKFILKDTMDSMPGAKRKVQRLYWMHRFIQITTGYYVMKMLFRMR